MNNDTPMTLYSMRLAESIWNNLVDDLQDEEITKIDRGESVFTESTFKTIIEFFKGKFLIFNENIKYSNEECDPEKRMLEHIKKEYNESEIKGNSYFVKTQKEKDFEIGCLRFNIIDASHELGHLFLDFETVEFDKVLWANGAQIESEYIVDTFSRAFVMPRERFMKIVSLYSYRNKCEIEKVAEAFGVPYISAYIRGKELHLWD